MSHTLTPPLTVLDIIRAYALMSIMLRARWPDVRWPWSVWPREERTP